MPYPPLPILGPTALTADAGNARAYLRWNLQMEDPRVVAWHVLLVAPERKTLNAQPLTQPEFVARGLANGTACTFAVVGLLKDGTLTPQSNLVTVTPRDTGTAKVSGLDGNAKISVGAAKDVPLGRWAVKITFPDGQELVYDRLRPVDWKTRGGEHLLYPVHFGNGLDVGRFDPRGLPRIIPPGGLQRSALDMRGDVSSADAAAFTYHDPQGGAWSAAGGAFTYHDLQFGYRHPHLTDPLTFSLDQKLHGDARVQWFEPQVDGDRVTVHWWQPMAMAGYTSWQWVQVWETWWPLERDRHGTKYHGLARLLEVQAPDAWKAGFQVMLNNGFGPGGSREGLVSYNTGFRKPGHEVVDFSGDKNKQVFFQHLKLPRAGSGYHSNMDSLQSSPLLFYDWGAGSLTIAARSLYYHCTNNSTSYIEQGADGVWPNLAWDLGAAPQRTAVDTVEYLFAPDTSQPLPQRYVNARFEALGDVSRRMGVQDDLAAACDAGSLGQVKNDGGPVAHAGKRAPVYAAAGADAVHTFHDFWHAVPETVDDAYRLDEAHDCNPAIGGFCDVFHKAGFRVGFWFRPEVAKTSLLSALSHTMPTAEMYYGFQNCAYPNAVALLKERGMPVVRDHPDWIRCQIDGGPPVGTAYQWIPMSMAGEWWDRIMWPTLVMSRRLGFDWVLMDGGFGGLQGVDYAPMRLGRAASAVPCQPYWWRMFRSMKALGIRNFGECTLGWKGGTVSLFGPGDEHYLWMYQAGAIWSGNDVLTDPVRAHKLFQLYNGTGGDQLPKPAITPVCRYAAKFFRSHRSPDWVELKDLRAGDPVTVTVDVAESPVAGGATRVSADAKYTFTVRPWTWTDAVWHYDDGSQAVYPAYEKIDWAKE